MLKLDNSLLEELGLAALPEDQKKAMLQHIYETLELRVGTDLANQMTDQQLEEFERFIDDGGDANQAQALQWLEANLPNYKEVVNRVFEELKGEIKTMSDQIIASLPPLPQASASTAAVPGTVSQPQQQSMAAGPAQQPISAAPAPQSAPVDYAQPYAPQTMPSQSMPPMTPPVDYGAPSQPYVAPQQGVPAQPSDFVDPMAVPAPQSPYYAPQPQMPGAQPAPQQQSATPISAPAGPFSQPPQPVADPYQPPMPQVPQPGGPAFGSGMPQGQQPQPGYPYPPQQPPAGPGAYQQ